MLMRALRPDPLDAVRVEDLVDNFLNEGKEALQIFPDSDFHNALHQFVEKEEKNAISE